MKKAIICDLDGTLFNIEHRLHFIKGEKKDWKAFNREIEKDSLISWCHTLVSMYLNTKDYQVIFVTGRMATEKAKQNTLEQLVQAFGEPLAWRLHMRKDEDYRKDCIVKKEIYEKNIEPFYLVDFCIDDRQQVVDMWREIGLVCLQCAKGDF